MAVIGEAFVRVRPQTTGFGAAAESGVLGGLRGIVAKGAAILGGIFIAKELFHGLGEVAKAGADANRQIRLINQAIESTGHASNVSSEEVQKYAEKQALITGNSKEQILALQQVELRFTNIKNAAGAGNDIFTRTADTAQNVSAALGKGLQPSLIAVGKAIDSPAQGLTGLTRFGIRFTQQTKDQIKTLVEQGRTMDAQKVVLQQLETRFGGAAAASANFGTKLKATIANTKEQVGQAVVPALAALNQGLIPVVPLIGKALSSAFNAIIPTVIPILKQVGPVLLSVVSGLAPTLVALGATAARVIGGLAPAIEALANAAKALAPIFEPIGQVIGALAQTFSAIATPAIQGFADILGSVVSAVLPPLNAALQVVANTIDAVGQVIGDSLGPVFERLAPIIGQVAGLLAGILSSAIRTLAPTILPVVTAFSELSAAIGQAFIATLQALLPAFTEIAKAIVPLVGPIGQLAKAFGFALVQAVRAIAPSLPALGQALGQLGIAFADILVAITPIIPPLTQLAVLLITTIGVPTIVALSTALAVLATAFANIFGNTTVLVPVLATLGTLWAVDKVILFATAVRTAAGAVISFAAAADFSTISTFVRALFGIGEAAQLVTTTLLTTDAAVTAEISGMLAAIGARVTAESAVTAAELAEAQAGQVLIAAQLEQISTSEALTAARAQNAELAFLSEGQMAEMAALTQAAAAAEAQLTIADEAAAVAATNAAAARTALATATEAENASFTTAGASSGGLIGVLEGITGASGVAAVAISAAAVGAAALAAATAFLITKLFEGTAVFKVLGAVVLGLTLPFTGAAVAVLELVQHFGTLVDFVKSIPGFFTALPGRIASAITAIPGVVIGAFQSIIDFLVGNWQQVLITAATAPFLGIEGLILAALGSLIPGVQSTFSAIGSAITGALSAVAGAVGGVFTGIGASLLGALANAASSLASAAPGLFAQFFVFFEVELPQRIVLGLAFLGGFLIGGFLRAFIALNAALPRITLGILVFFATLPVKIVQAFIGLESALADVATRSAQAFVEREIRGFQRIFDFIGHFAQDLPGRVAAGFSAAISAVASVASEIPGFLNDAVTGAIPSFTSSAGELLVGVGTAMIGGLLSGLESARDALNSFFQDTLPNAILSAFQATGDFLSGTGSDVIAGLFQGMLDAVGQVGSFIASVVGAVIDGFKSGFGISSPATVMMPIGSDILLGIVQGALGAVGALASFIGSIPGRVIGAASNIAGALVPVGRAIMQELVNGAQAAFGTVASFFGSIAGRVVGLLLSSAGIFVSPGLAFVARLLQGASGSIGSLLSFFGSIPGRIVTALSNIGNTLVQVGVNAMQGIARGEVQGVNVVLSFVHTIPDKIVSAFSNVGSLLEGIGGDIMRGLIRGLQNAATDPIGVVKSIGGKILGAFKSVFGISSPSTLTAQIGLNIMQGLTNGVSDGTPAAVTQASNAGGKVVDAIVKGLKSQGVKVTDGFQQALDSALKAASPRDVSGVAHATGDAFVSGLQGVLNAGFSSGLNLQQSLASFAQENIKPAGALTGDQFNQAFNSIVQTGLGQGLTVPEAVAAFASTGIHKAFDPNDLIGFQNATLQVKQGLLDLQGTISAPGAVDSFNHALSDATKEGLSAQQSIQSYGASIVAAAQANVTATGDVNGSANALGLQAAQLFDVGTKAGVSTQKMADYISKALGIPKEAFTNVHNSADIARIVADQYHGRLDALPHDVSTSIHLNTGSVLTDLDAVDRRFFQMRQKFAIGLDVPVHPFYQASPAHHFESWSDMVQSLGSTLRSQFSALSPPGIDVQMRGGTIGGTLHPFTELGTAVNNTVQSGLARAQLTLPPVVVPTVQSVKMQIHAATVDVEGGSEHSFSTAGSVIASIVQTSANQSPVSIPATIDVKLGPNAAQQIKSAATQLTGSLDQLISGATSGLPQASNFIQDFGNKFTTAAINTSVALSKVKQAQAALVAAQHINPRDVQVATAALAQAQKVLAAAQSGSQRGGPAAILHDIARVQDAERILIAAQRGTGDLRSILLAAKALQDAQANLAKAQQVSSGNASITAFIHGLQSQANAAKAFMADLAVIAKRAPQLAADLAKAGPDAAGALADAFAHSSASATAAEKALIRANGAATNLSQFLTTTFGPLFGDSATQVGQSLADGIAQGLAGVLPAARAIVGQLKDVLGEVGNTNLTPQLTVPPITSPVPLFGVGTQNQPTVLQLDVTLTNEDGTVSQFVTSPIAVVPGSSLVQRVQAQTRAQ